MGVKVDTSEMTQLCARLKTKGARGGAQGAQVLRRAGFAIEADAKAAAPVDTGNLRSSIATTFAGDGRFGSMSAEVTAHAEYSAYVEFGTSRAAGQPFMVPAFERQLPGFESAVAGLGSSILD